MPILNKVEIRWVRCDEDNPQRYQNKKDAPAKWSTQVVVRDKKTADKYKEDFGMAFKPEEEDGKIIYKTSLSRFAFLPDDAGEEDLNRPNRPVNVILGNGERLDPKTIGNGSVANVSFTVKKDKSARTLVGIQVVKLLKFESNSDTDFELTDDFEVIDDQKDSLEDTF
jgi:hypothetical protein